MQPNDVDNIVAVHCRPIAHHEVDKKQSALRYVRIETAIALVCSFLINLFIVSVFAKVGSSLRCPLNILCMVVCRPADSTAMPCESAFLASTSIVVIMLVRYLLAVIIVFTLSSIG